jgi:hypothetical protein
MTDIDGALERMRTASVHPALADIEGPLLARLRAQQATGDRLSTRSFVAAGLAALSLGIAGSLVPGAPAQAAASPAPFGTTALALSTLLGGG